MAKLILQQNTFTSGEITPTASGRVETEEYKKGVAKATNMIIDVHGSIRRR
jgi:hypothetical protein